ARWVEAELTAAAGELFTAAKRFRSLIRSAKRLEQHAVLQAALNSLGELAAAQGKADEAIGHFENAASLVEELRNPLPGEEFRMAFLSRRLEPFHNLARLHIDAGRPVEALRWVERARSRSLAESVGGTAVSAPVTAADPLIDKLESARARLNSLYSRLDRGEDVDLPTLTSGIARLEKQISELGRRISGSAGKRSGGISDKFLDLDRLQRRLGSATALVEFVTFDGELSAFVVTSTEVSFVANFTSMAEVDREIEGLR